MENIKCTLCQANPKSQNINYFRQAAKSNSTQSFVICENCISLLSDALQTVKQNVKPKAGLPDFTPKDIYNHLSRFVIGQEDAKTSLSVAVFQHYQRIKNPTLKHKSNILMCGPTGSGKTYLVQIIAEFLNVPFAHVDLTSITPRGYVGESPESMIERLFLAAKGNVKQAEKGIIFLDEFDKIPAGHEQGSFKAKILQGEILKLLEGDIVDIRLSEQGQKVSINTKNILFIAAGAFSGLEELKKEKPTLGITQEKRETEPQNKKDLKPFLKFGLIPELLGRFPVTCFTEPLSENELIEILRNSEDSILRYYKELFFINGVELELKEDLLRDVAKKALKEELGARGLKRQLEERFKDILFQIDNFKGKKLSVGLNSLEVKL